MIDVGMGIDLTVNRRARAVARQIMRVLSPFPAVEVIPGYTNVLVRYDPNILDYDTVADVVRQAATTDVPEKERTRRFVLPVAYGGEFGPDLDDVARSSGLSPDEIIRRHANRDYPIFCLGFSPGFPFLGELDPSLHTPRLETPRPRVPRGSVAIGGAQTGVYPTPMPGGWRLIGRTPLLLFDIGRAPPVPYEAGDVLRFEPIDAAEFARLEQHPQMPEGTPLR
jgi:KipI family sensor histidine kinase inhibitor